MPNNIKIIYKILKIYVFMAAVRNGDLKMRSRMSRGGKVQ